MFTLTQRFRRFAEPLVAVVFFAGWGVIVPFVMRGESPGLGYLMILAVYSGAVAVTRVLPYLSLGIILVMSVFLFFAPGALDGLLTLVVLSAGAFVAFLIALSGKSIVKWFALAVVMVQSVILGAGMASGVGLFGLPSASTASDDFGARALLGWTLIHIAIGMVLTAVAWLAGFAISLAIRREQDKAKLEATEAELTAAGYQLRTEKERAEIAQEVHDVLAHSLAVVIAVADGSRFLQASKPETTERALVEIADTARTALIDLRGLIEGLRDDAGNRPQPGLADIEAMTNRLALAGMTVNTTHSGTPEPLTTSQELAVYRIVQESLTNVLKHSGANPVATIAFTWESPGLALAITSTGDSLKAGELTRDDGSHYGIHNMKDRAKLAGGWLSAGFDDEPRPSYVVAARIPTASEKWAELEEAGTRLSERMSS